MERLRCACYVSPQAIHHNVGKLPRYVHQLAQVISAVSGGPRKGAKACLASQPHYLSVNREYTCPRSLTAGTIWGCNSKQGP